MKKPRQLTLSAENHFLYHPSHPYRKLLSSGTFLRCSDSATGTKEKTAARQHHMPVYGALPPKILSFFMACFLSLLFFACAQTPAEDSLPFIDLRENYEKKEMCVQDIAEVNYIPFQTDSAYLLPDRMPECITKDYIIFINNTIGSILVFDHSGKIAHIIHRRGEGPEEYARLRLVSFDERKKELICFLSIHKVIKIYRLDGSYVKTLPSKNNDYMDIMHRYNDSLLICWNNGLRGNTEYFFLGLRDTMQFEDILSIPAEEAINRDIIKRGHLSAVSVTAPVGQLVYQNGRYLIADPARDTIYRLTDERVLEPVFTRRPSVRTQTPPVVLDYGLESKDYLFMTAVELAYNFDTNEGLTQTPYLWEKKTGKIYRTNVYNRDYPEDPDYFFTADQLVSGHLVHYLPADKLIEALENNQLYGKLKEIASRLREEDNGVLMMIDVN